MKLHKYFYTLRHLKPIQLHYQLCYRLRKKFRILTGYKYPLSIEKEGHPVKLKPSIPRYTSFNNYTFTFLNQSKTFQKNAIHWNYSEYGKLWTYNLNYFDFLLQPNMNSNIGWELIDDYISQLNNNFIGLEPYPICLRCINWIKFISQNASSSPPLFTPSQLHTFSSSLFAQYQILLDNLEYHLLGNHLLENGFSLLFGAIYFKDNKLYTKAQTILNEQLKEQILDDGSHFELSTMYHQIILHRLLDCINLLQNNQRFDNQNQLLQLMEEKTQKMIHWLNQMTFSNGHIPLLNDSAPGIAPTTQQLNDYAIRLGVTNETATRDIHSNACNLNDSGYRRFNGTNYECIIDIGSIGPSYQPGHAHADTFNFVLHIQNKSVIVDTGLSTYNPGKTRLKERGTTAHNTVTIENKKSSEVWSSFRVARRAKVNIIKDGQDSVIAQHNGYKKSGITHQREWYFDNDRIKIIDILKNKYGKKGTAYFHFHFNLEPEIIDNKIYLNEKLLMELSPNAHITKEDYKQAYGFNILKNAKQLKVDFIDNLFTEIYC